MMSDYVCPNCENGHLVPTADKRLVCTNTTCNYEEDLSLRIPNRTEYEDDQPDKVTRQQLAEYKRKRG